LAHDGFDAEWVLIPASLFVDQRLGRRMWLLVSTLREGLEGLHQTGREKPLQPTQGDVPRFFGKAHPRVYRRGDGVADRVERTRVIGNGWVPQVAVIPMGRVAQLLGADLDETQTNLFAD
jgi:hypothetical protein